MRRDSSDKKKQTVQTSMAKKNQKASAPIRKVKRKIVNKPKTVRRSEIKKGDGFLRNRFEVLARLTCSQKKELDRTGTLKMPKRIPVAHVYTTTATPRPSSPEREEDRNEGSARRPITRAQKQTMTEPFVFTDLPNVSKKRSAP